MIIDEAQRLGRVTPEKAAQMKSTAWSERYYVEYEFGKELRDAGFETDMPSGKTSQAQTARYQRLRARRSTSEVRQFYTDPKTGKPVELSGEFTLKKYGTPQNALKAARDWAKTEIAEGRLTKQHIKEPLPIITDVEMGGLGLINSTGVFRFGELRRLINDNIKSQIFNTYAQMGEMARLTKADIPLNRHGEWTAEPLRGREWGALEGRYVHKKLLRHMNSWDQFNHVMEGVFQSMIEQVGQTMDITKLKHLKEGKPGGPISKVMRSWKHTLIVGRIGSWISNHVSNLHSAVIMGVNPLSRRYWEGYTEYGRIADAVANGDMTALTKAEAADFKYMHDNGLLGATVGTPSAGLAGKVAGTGLFRLDKVLKKTRKHHQAQMNKQLRRVELVERSIARIDDFLDAHNNNVRRLKKGELEKLTKQRERFSGLLKHEQRKIPKLMTKHPMLQMVEAGVKDTFRAMLDSERSILAQHFASHYSNIDPAHKYTMFKALRSKGWSRAAALQEVSDFTQNYNFVPPAVRRLKEYSLSSPLGAFTPSFPWEAGRIMKNMIRKTPGKALTYMAAIPAFNIGMLASHGLSYNDIKQMYGFESDHEALTAFMSNVYVPTDTGLEAVNMNKYGYLGSFTQSGGAMSPIIDRVAIPTIENNMGAVPAMALGAGLNYASQFVANNPLTNWLSSRFLGVDPYTKELTLGTNQNLGKWAWDSVAELGKLSLPGSYAALEQSMGKVDAPSVVTGHRRTMLQGFISGALGINWSSWKRSEAIGRMAMSYARPEQLDPFLRDMMTDERRELTSKVRHARQALDQGDTEKYQQYFDEAAAIMEEQEKDKGKFIAGKWQSTTKTRMAIEKKLTEHIGRNVFQFIEGTSIDRLPRFAHDAWTSGWVGKDSAEMQHIWRQMQDMDYLSNSGNSQQLERALTDIAMYSARTSDPELRANMDKASMTVAVQWLKTMLAEEKAKSPEQLIRDLLAGKKGAELRALQRVWQAARP